MKEISRIGFLFAEFCIKAPALSLGVTGYLSATFSFGSSLCLFLFTLFILPTLFFFPKRCIVLIAIFFAFSFLLHLRLIIPEEGAHKGNGRIIITKIDEKSLLFGKKGWTIQGNLLEFHTKNKKVAAHLPFITFIPQKWGRPKANSVYAFEGIVLSKKNQKMRIRCDPASKWTTEKKISPLAEWRYLAKKATRCYIQKKIRSKEGALFLAALITGDHEEIVMKKNFNRVGLSHLLAISGFHFSLLAFFFYLFLQPFFKPAKKASLLIFFLTTYLLFIGKSASIERAYIMIICYLVSQLTKRRYSALNSLGAALTILIWKEPRVVFEMGFQFSFLATAAILLFFTPLEKGLSYLIPRRTFSSLLTFSILSQHALFLLVLARKSLALNLAVFISLAPLSVFYFGNFPVGGLITNLFFPFLVSVSLFLLLLGLVFPILGKAIHMINTHYTNLLLTFIDFPPPIFSTTIWIKDFPLWILSSYLALLFFAGVCFKAKEEKKRIYGDFAWM